MKMKLVSVVSTDEERIEQFHEFLPEPQMRNLIEGLESDFSYDPDFYNLLRPSYIENIRDNMLFSFKDPSLREQYTKFNRAFDNLGNFLLTRFHPPMMNAPLLVLQPDQKNTEQWHVWRAEMEILTRDCWRTYVTLLKMATEATNEHRKREPRATIGSVKKGVVKKKKVFIEDGVDFDENRFVMIASGVECDISDWPYVITLVQVMFGKKGIKGASVEYLYEKIKKADYGDAMVAGRKELVRAKKVVMDAMFAANKKARNDFGITEPLFFSKQNIIYRNF